MFGKKDRGGAPRDSRLEHLIPVLLSDGKPRTAARIARELAGDRYIIAGILKRYEKKGYVKKVSSGILGDKWTVTPSVRSLLKGERD